MNSLSSQKKFRRFAMRRALRHLAQKIHVPYKWCYNAAYNAAHGMAYRPNSQTGQVNYLMQAYGVTWDDILPKLHGGRGSMCIQSNSFSPGLSLDNPATCPAELMHDLNGCPFDKGNEPADCAKVPQWAWLPILEKRIPPEENP